MENIKYIQKVLELLHYNFDVVQYILKVYWLFKILFYKLFHKCALNRKKKMKNINQRQIWTVFSSAHSVQLFLTIHRQIRRLASHLHSIK